MARWMSAWIGRAMKSKYIVLGPKLLELLENDKDGFMLLSATAISMMVNEHIEYQMKLLALQRDQKSTAE